MNAPSPSPLLRPVLRIFGLIFIFGIFVLNRLWPSGWAGSRSSQRICR